MFITLEGIGGAGKSTVVEELKRRHRDWWYFSAEPCTKTMFGALARAGIDGTAGEFNSPLAYETARRGMLHLMDLARYEHLAMIEERLHADGLDWGSATVVLDRYTASTLVYQQEHWPMALLIELCRRHLRPDLGILLDCSPEVAVSRLDPDDDYDGHNVRLRRMNYLALWDARPASTGNGYTSAGYDGNSLLGRAGALCGRRRVVTNTTLMPVKRVVSLVEEVIAHC